MRRPAYSAFVFSLILLPTAAKAQADDRAERWRADCERGWNSDRVNFCELRTYTVAAGSRISVDGGAMAACRSSARIGVM